MQPNIKRLFITVIFSFLGFLSFAQDTTQASGQTVDQVMRSNDKIYVVMAVCILILIAFLFYLIRIDIKVSKLEKERMDD